MFDQVFAARPFRQHRRQQPARRIQLMVARENPALQALLVITHRHQIAAQDFQPAIALPDFFPKIGGGGAIRVVRIARAEVSAPIEGQEFAVWPGQQRAHLHFAIAGGEMHQRAAGEGQQRFRQVLARRTRQPVIPVLVHRILDRLRIVAFQFRSGDRNAIQEQHQIQAVFMVQGIAHLPHHAQAVGGVARLQGFIHGERRAELAEAEALLQPHHIQPMAQHIQSALLVQSGAQALHQGGAGSGAMGLLQRGPGFGLGGFHPG